MAKADINTEIKIKRMILLCFFIYIHLLCIDAILNAHPVVNAATRTEIKIRKIVLL